LGKGAPVIVVGHVYTSEYEDRDGNRRSSLEMRATSVGPDLSRVIVRIEKPGYTGPDADSGAAAVAAGGGAGNEDAAAGDDQAQAGDAADAPSSLPLSA
jgi:single-strand DNA-binding protein